MFFGRVVVQFCVMRMHANARKNVVVTLSHRDRPPKIVRVRVACADVEHRRDAGIAGPLNDIVAIVVKRLAVDMAMRIYQEHFLYSVDRTKELKPTISA
jgi:hypothetical protein